MTPSPDQIEKEQLIRAEIEGLQARHKAMNAESAPHESNAATLKYVDSSSPARTVNNTMRHQYKVLSDSEKANMLTVKDQGLALHDFLATLGNSRELSLAKTKVEEAVMWAVKHITG